jgi:hypothetical protein
MLAATTRHTIPHEVPMFRLSLLLATAVALPALAQPEPEVKDGKQTIPLTLHPTAAPVPLSKMSLYPDYADQTPGNRVQGLLKVFMEQDNFFRLMNSEEWQKYLTMPLADLPDDLRVKTAVMSGIQYDGKYTTFLGYLDKGARYASVDWNEFFDLRKDGFYLLLPEVQKIRALASVAKMRLRGELKAGEFARAATTVKTMLGLGQAMEHHPTLIGQLVGVAIDQMAVTGVEEMIAQPGCPNLYWALTDVPQPLISLRRGVGGERLFLIAQFEKFLTADRAWTEKEFRDLFDTLDEVLVMEQQRGGSVLPKMLRGARLRFAVLAADSARMTAARERLVAEGRSADGVKAMTDLQIAVLDDFHRYEILRDDYFKAIHLPYHEGKIDTEKAEKGLLAARTRGDIVGPALLPATWKVKQAQVRLDQRVAFLRTIEAVRLYAHAHKGELPAKLADLTVPVPTDPVTGKPFEYAVADGVATLGGGKLLNVREYKLTVKK